MTENAVVKREVFDMTPSTFAEAIQFAEILSKSAMIPDQYRDKPGDILIAVQYGAEIGLKPMQALQGIAVINGRPTVWGDAALAVVLASGEMEEYHEMTVDEIRAAGKAVFTARRKGRAEPIVREFSIDDAKKARLLGNEKKPIWNQYTERMLQMRARSWGLRDGFADVLKGMKTTEEVRDYEVIEDGAQQNKLALMKQKLVEMKNAPKAQTQAPPAPRQEPPPPQDQGQSAPANLPHCPEHPALTVQRFKNNKTGHMFYRCGAWSKNDPAACQWSQNEEREPGSDG